MLTIYIMSYKLTEINKRDKRERAAPGCILE